MSETETGSAIVEGGELSIPSGSMLDGGDREAALAEVRKAIRGEVEEDTAAIKEKLANSPQKILADKVNETLAKAEGEGAPTSAQDKPAPDEASIIKKRLKDRERVVKERQQAKEESDRIMADVRRAQYEIQAQAAQLRKEREYWDLLKSDPAAAVRHLGLDPEQFVMDLAAEGTPEGKLQRKLRAQEEELSRVRSWQKSLEENSRKELEKMQEAQFKERRAKVESDFIGLALNTDKHPHLSAMYEGREHALIAEADYVADQFREATGGEDASLEDIADYLEELLETKYKEASSKLKGGSKKPAVPVGKASLSTKTQRTLTDQDTSERRTLRKDYADLDDDERKQVAREAVAAAFRASGHRT